MYDSLTGIVRTKVDGSDVEWLAGAVRDAYDKVAAADDSGPKGVAEYLTDHAAQFAASRAVSGTALSHNTATAVALLNALETLEQFYDAELVGC